MSASKNNRAENILRSFERSVGSLAQVFQQKRAFNFSHELELVMYLLMKTRDADKDSVDKDGIPIYLARIEWPCVPNRSIDMVIWKPGSETEARKNWGTVRGKLAKQVPLLAAIQVKRGGGNVTGVELTKKDLVDLETIYDNTDLGKPKLYFIEYADEDLREKDGDYSTYLEAKDILRKWCSSDSANRRAFLISRDGIGFYFPRNKWMINPLPGDTKQTR